jgi:hypothetical protein
LPSWVSRRRQQKGRKKEKEKVWIGKKIRKVFPPLSDKKKTEKICVKTKKPTITKWIDITKSLKTNRKRENKSLK